MPDNRTYRIKANIQGEDFVNVNLNLNQDVSVFEFLSLNIDTENLYRFHTANYGCVAGRVLANNAVGVPNVKISIFIAADENTDADAILHYLYPYKDTMDKNSDGIRYNLLPEEQLFLCHQNVGTFPLKRMVLDDNNVLEIFDKYYKFTTTTNSAGDYMIFGVPIGTQILHMDVDLSDIGDLLSQRPRDFIYKGYDVNQFENANMFKKDKNLGTLTQIFTQNESVNVQPFWGEVAEMGEVDSTGVRITRKDINLNYKFEPTCIFMGSLITDEKSNGFTKRCIPTERMGKMDRITTGEGTIEMIRKTPDGKVEEFSIMGNQLIDGNGTWCYQIPMNLDYVKTDEWGNIVATNDIEKGLPTRASVRFRFSLNDFASDYQNNHLTKMLVPNNPMNVSEMGDTYAFGTKTPDGEFRDLFWNKVYSVKSYIPRLQKSNTNREKRFSGIKAVNVNVGNNPIPYNNMRIDITFMFVLQCAIMHMLIWIAGIVNGIVSWAFGLNLGTCYKAVGKSVRENGCVTIGDGACPDLDGWYFAPRCKDKKLKNGNPLSYTLDMVKVKEGYAVSNLSESTVENLRDVDDPYSIGSENDEEGSICLTNRMDYFIKCIEMSLAQEYEVIQFDFYNDWINGLIYVPRWFANIKKKRKYLFGLVGPKKTKVQACMEGRVNYQRRYVQQCALEYKKDSDSKYSIINSANGCVPGKNKSQKCHKGKGRKNVKIVKNTNPGGGYIHDEQTMRGEYVYYFRPCDWYGGNRKKINYFATDIILLGSLSIHDMDGVPQSFKELTSSSYQMPTNIAATNMDTVAYMYGSTSSGGAICSGAGIRKDLQQNENTFESYQKWARGTDYGDDIDNDPNEYEVTEAAGIDWGYTGPGQRYLIRQTGNKKEYADYNNSFYQPGGHFLGIACFNAESNVKSCVNLSRICEFGATMSQRQAIVRRNGDVLEDDKAFLVPTGIISKDEISDGGFRSEFATLNHNGLATRINPDTNRREYIFVSMQPNNFDGSLAEKTTSTAYNNLNGVREPEGSSYVSATAYTRTIEDKSIDYYDFRLGVGNVDWADNRRSIDDKYLLTSGNIAYLPIYNNSYYFYFGLRDGSTALDRFYKEFFAQCPDINEGVALIKITAEGVKSCDDPNSGKVTIYIGGIDTTTNIMEYVCKKDGVVYKSGTYPPGASYLEIDGLPVGSYEITFSSEALEDIVRSFSISETAPDFASEIEIDIEDFTVTKYDDDISDTDGRGSVTVSWPTDAGIQSIILSSATPGHIVTLSNGVKQYLWTDERYTIIANYTCGSQSEERPYNVYSFTPSMPKEFDLLIGGSSDVTYNKKIKGKLQNSDWWINLLSDGSANDKFYTEKAVAFKGSLFDGNSGKIDVSLAYGGTPYETNLYGDGEQIGETEGLGIALYLGQDTEEYDLNYSNFLYPTLNEPSSPIGYVLYNSNGTRITSKNNYSANFTDQNGMGERIPFEANQNLTLPSIYKPFFVRCAIIKDALTNVVSNRYSLTIVNGSVYDDKFNEVSVCGSNITPVTYNQGQWWTLTGGNVEDFQVQKYDGSLPNGSDINYRIYVKEGEADINNPVYSAKEIAETVRFIGDGGVPDSTVRYFMLFRANEYEYRQKSSDTNANYTDVLRNKIINAISFSDGTHLKDGQIGDDIYWSGSCTKAFKIALGDGGYLFFNPKYEINRSKIFSGDLSAIDEANKNTSDCFVLGVYDPWTQLSDEDFASAQNDAQVSDAKWRFTGKDSDMLAIFKLYPVDRFISFVQNPNMYPEISESEDDTQSSFTVQTSTFREYIEAGYDENGDIETAYVNETATIATFNINDNQKQINIPEFRITISGPYDSSMDTGFRMYLQNEDDVDNRFYIDLLSSYGSGEAEGEFRYEVTGTVTVRSIADSVLSRDMGTGTYTLNVDYGMELEGRYGLILSGSMTIGSERIQVITV